jgi:hypothetical protein
MAIEILQRGITPEEKTYKANCTRCESVLSFKQSDATFHSDDIRGEDTVSITCPVCFCKIYVMANRYTVTKSTGGK